MPTRESLLTATRALTTAFSNPSTPPSTLLSTFTTNPPPLIHEHGLPVLAPFLGRDFTGRDGVREYFGLIGELLGVEEMRFDDEREWVVDVGCMAVSLRGWARFVWKGTGEKWEERFTYRIGLAEELGGCGHGNGNGHGGEEEGGKGELKVREYLVWADTGAAYLASRGELRGLLEGKEGGVNE